jgi:hypothetical protein
MGRLFCRFLAGRYSMLTVGWQQVASITGQHSNQGIFSMMILYGLDLWTAMSPLLTPRWQQGVASLKRLLRKSGAL